MSNTARAVAGSVLSSASALGQNAAILATQLVRSARNSITIMRTASSGQVEAAPDEAASPAELRLIEATLERVEKLVEGRAKVQTQDGFDSQLVCGSCGVLASICYTTTKGFNLCGRCYDKNRHRQDRQVQWYSTLDPPKVADCYANVRVKHIIEEAFGPAGEVTAIVRDGERMQEDDALGGAEKALEKYREAWTLCSVYGGAPTAVPVETAEEIDEHYARDLDHMAMAVGAAGAEPVHASDHGQPVAETARQVLSVDSDAGAADMETDLDRMASVTSFTVGRVDSMTDVQPAPAHDDRIGDDVRSYVCIRLAEAELAVGQTREAFEHAVLALALYPDSPMAEEIRRIIGRCVREAVAGGGDDGSTGDESAKEQQLDSIAAAIASGDPNGSSTVGKWLNSAEGLIRRLHGFVRWRSLAEHLMTDVADACECPCCFMLLYEPVTLPTGHTLCKTCVRRCLEVTNPATGTALAPVCPCTRQPLDEYMVWINLDPEHLSTNAGLEAFIRKHFAEEYAARKVQTEQELKDSMSEDGWIPIFVCMVVWPGVPCALHVFEPRYRLMMRRCMDSGFRKFGMCAYVQGAPFSDVGTMLVIRDLRTLPDGRMLVDTVGYRRFKVIERGMRDGYNIAKVQYFSDVDDPGLPIDADNEAMRLRREATLALANDLREKVTDWLSRRSEHIRSRVLDAYGEVPEDPVLLSFWLCAFAFGQAEVIELLATDSLNHRLNTVNGFVRMCLS